jgi:uncharacterized protein (TIGR00299 family) protein
MTRLAWFNCFSGIAGDMALGALLDAGADVAEVERWCRRLPVRGWTLRSEPVLRAGLAATRAVVAIESDGHPHRRAADILQLIAGAGLPPRAAQRAIATFEVLAEVEGRLHGVPSSEVHFHEVGAVDSIVDIVGVCVALELLEVDEISASAVAHGTGTIRAAHGVLPNPPPAVVALLARAAIPSQGLDEPRELTTPTGAALLAALGGSFGPMPAMVPAATGFGAGGRDPDGRPNVVQVVVGDVAAGSDAGFGGQGQDAVVLEATVDDATGETLAYAVVRLLEEGAFDAWTVPVTMKKGRPGHVLTVLADPVHAPRLREILSAETGSFGVRAHPVQRWPLARRFAQVDVEGQTIRIKVSGGRAKAEHDDVARAARALRLPLREVAARAETAWRLSPEPAEGRPPADGSPPASGPQS